MKQEINLYIKYALLLLLIVLVFLVVKPYLAILSLSIILAYMAMPVQRFLKPKLRSETAAAAVLTFLIFLIIVIPLLILANVMLNEAAQIYRSTDVEMIKDLISTQLNIEISETTQTYINSITKTAAGFILTKVADFVLSIPNLIVSFFIMLFMLFFALRDGEKVFARFTSIIPMEEHYKKRFQKKVSTTIESLFYGTVALAAIEAVVAIIGFYFLGVDSPITWGFIIGLTAVIPAVGATIVWIPMALVSLLQGNTLNAILIALFGFLILSTLIDTIIRARILGARAEIHPLIIVVGVLGGLAAFGFIGILIGPLVLTVFELIIEIYTEIKDETHS